MKRIYIILGVVIVVLVVGYLADSMSSQRGVSSPDAKNSEEYTKPVLKDEEWVTISGTYVCLPFLPSVSVTPDCAFGIRTEEGEHYAVNFGAGAGSMADFEAGAKITARGTIILRNELQPDSWGKFEMKGLFTVYEKE